jgi:hypothetical protein
LGTALLDAGKLGHPKAKGKIQLSGESAFEAADAQLLRI